MTKPLHRANALVAYAITILLCLLSGIALTSAIYQKSIDMSGIPVELKINKFEVKQGRIGFYYDYSTPLTDLAFLNFDLEADLASIWDWNTKQFFVCLVLEYSTSVHDVNEIVIWDEIISEKSRAKLSIQRQDSEYMASDMSNKLSGISGNITLHWEVVPYVGFLTWHKIGAIPIKTSRHGTAAPITGLIFPPASQ